MRATSRAATSSFAWSGQELDAVACDEVHRVAVAPDDAGHGRNIVGDDPVAALRSRLARAFAITCSVSAAKPMTRRGRSDGGEDVGVRARS